MLKDNINWPGSLSVITAMLTVLLCTGISSSRADVDPVVVSLKGKEVTLSEFNGYFDVAVRMLARQRGVPFGSQSDEQIASLRRQYLSQFGAEMALLQEAISRGIEVNEDDINQQITAFKSALGEETLADAGFKDEAQLRRLLKEKQMVKNLTDMLVDEIYIPAGDVLTLHHDIQHELMLPEQVCLRHIVVDDEKMANQLIAQIRGGEDFESLASEVSTDTNTAEKGGDLGCYQRDGAEGARSEFENVAFDTKPGEIGGPVESEFGYHIIDVYQYRPARAPTADEAYEELENDLKHEKLPEKLMEVREASELVTYPDRLDG